MRPIYAKGLLTVNKDTIRREVIVSRKGDDDLSETSAAEFATEYIAQAGQPRAWFYRECERLNYDCIKVIFYF